MTNYQPFQYTFRSYDMKDLDNETKEIIDSKDREIERYIAYSMLPMTHIRAGTGVAVLPALNAGVGVTYSGTQFDNINIAAAFDDQIPFKGIILNVTNGDPAANPAILGVQSLGINDFNIYHLGNGNVGANFRFNVTAIAYL